MPNPPSTCPACGSADIVPSIGISQTAESGRVGLSFQAKLLVLPIIGTEPLLADLCNHCGLVIRLYVRTVGKPWVRS